MTITRRTEDALVDSSSEVRVTSVSAPTGLIEAGARLMRSQFKPTAAFNPVCDILQVYWSCDMSYVRREGEGIYSHRRDDDDSVVGVKLYGIKRLAASELTFWQRAKLLFGVLPE